MATFSLPQCPHCAQAGAQGKVMTYAFHPTEPLNFVISGACLTCQQPIMGLGKIAFEHRMGLPQAREIINQYQGPLEQLPLIQLIRWVPLPQTVAHTAS